MSDIFDFDKPDRYAVMGNPVKHSKSPQIHKAFAKETGQFIEYTAIQVDVGGFKQAVSHFQAHGGKGLNVTVPFKVDAWKLSDTLSKRAQRAGAVNTLMLNSDGSIDGDNTDGIGLVKDMVDRLGWPLRHKKVLILGAGGAVRGVLAPILEQQPQQLVIANRTASKAQQLADAFADLGTLSGGGYEALQGQQFDLVINGTAASLQGKLPPLPEQLLCEPGYCYDMMYASEPTAFMRWAQQQGIRHISDGLGMLVGQAAESFWLWRGVRPSVAPVIKSIRQGMLTG